MEIIQILFYIKNWFRLLAEIEFKFLDMAF